MPCFASLDPRHHGVCLFYVAATRITLREKSRALTCEAVDLDPAATHCCPDSCEFGFTAWEDQIDVHPELIVKFLGYRKTINFHLASPSQTTVYEGCHALICIFNMVWYILYHIWTVSQIMALGTPRKSRNSQDIECICVTICGISIDSMVDVNPNGSSLCWNRSPNSAFSTKEFQKWQVLQTRDCGGTWILYAHEPAWEIQVYMMNLMQFNSYRTLPRFFWHVSMYLVGTSLKSGRFEVNPTRITSQTNASASHDVNQDSPLFQFNI